MKQDIIDELKERGIIKQIVFEDELHELIKKKKCACYCGFDPSMDSLTIGHGVALTLLVRMARAGFTPIALVGGATGQIGDPTGRNDMRPEKTMEQLNHNLSCIKKQITDFFERNGVDNAIIVNNDDWTKKLSYYDFLNEIAKHMSVNRMLASECFKSRMENGLTLAEFVYMPMQAYDFLSLFKEHNCMIEMGGDDQWGNILAGVELIRRKERKPAFAFTLPLLTKADGTKMSKSAGGAVWLDPKRTSDFEMFQYMRNTADNKVEEYLRMLTLLPLDEIKKLCQGKGKELNHAKEVLAYEVVRILRGEKSAEKALEQSKSAFGGDASDIPTKTISSNELNIVDCLVAVGFAGSRGDAKRLIQGGGIKVGEKVIDNFDFVCPKDEFVLYKGKKTLVKVKVA
ncbi:MAG: tyrosine--tRNA ligase [Clostridia bacterium]|nr:tyrosine--tRNA ligase [Clostridia bacterium]